MSTSSVTTQRTACPLDCPDTCSLEVQVRDGRVVQIDGTRDNPITAGFICRKVRRYHEHVYGADRLLTPARRVGAKGEGRFEPISWDDALAEIAEAMRSAIERHGPESILPYCYGGSNGYLTQDTIDARLFRRLGASQLARVVCAAPSGRAAAGLYGKMPGVAMDDYVHARLIVVWGANPSASGIHLVPYIRQAQQSGARLVVVDPRRTPLAKRADLHLAVRPGTDVPVALSVVRWLFEEGLADTAFLAQHATGADELRQRAAAWTFDRAAEVAGVEKAALEQFAKWYAEINPAVIRCGWGPERNRNGGSSVASVLALPAVAGKFGVRGGGYTASNSSAWNFSADAAAAEPNRPRRVINMNLLGRVLLEERDPPIDVLFVYNSNALATTPNQQAVRAGLSREDLFTVVFDQVRTDTARYADVLLPATTFLEHSDCRRGYGSPYLLRSEPVIERFGQARPNYEVFAALCERLGVQCADDPQTPEELFSRILDSASHGAATRKALAQSGLAAPACGAHPVQFVDVFPATPDRKVHLAPEELDREVSESTHGAARLYDFRPDPATAEYPLALISPALAQAISSNLAQLIDKPAAVELHPDDARARGLQDGDAVRVFNSYGETHCLARVNADLRPGVALLPKGLWSRHTLNGSTANALAPDTLADLGGGACFNDARVEVERLAPRKASLAGGQGHESPPRRR